mmetsp:Transcript_18741/g.24489  ORF Transcript_18741/g.24489 Transcript_18741/m.24489 type:complete len:360 (+) Transcript_18741:106-1185(+)
MERKAVKVVLLGFGSVSQHVCKILLEKQNNAKESAIKGKIIVVAACDSSGGVYSPSGLDLAALLKHKESKKYLFEYSDENSNSSPSELRRFKTGLELVTEVSYDLLVDASPVNLETGYPGYQCAKKALERNLNVVFANKAPLVLDYAGIRHLESQSKGCIRFSATVCGGLPVINVGQRDLVGAHISSIEGIFNSTTNYVLSQMQQGFSRESALKTAQERGIAEADPTLDVAGIDSANKLVIIANTLLERQSSVKLSDVKVKGIEQVSQKDLSQANLEGCTIKLLASAKYDAELGTYQYAVGPTKVPLNSFLGNSNETDMCIVFTTDIYETISLKTNETGVFPTSAAVIRDILHLSFGSE